MSVCLCTGVGPGEVHASVEAGREGWLVCLRVSVQELVQERYTPQWRLDGRCGWYVCVSQSACLYIGVGPGEVHAAVEAGREGWLGCLCVSVQELVQERYMPQWRLDGRGDWYVCVSLYRSWSRRGTRLSGGWTGGVVGMSACLCTGVGPGEVHASVEAGREGWLVCLHVSVQELVQERYTPQWRLDRRGGWDVCVSLYRSWSMRGTRLSGGWTGGVTGMSVCLCTGVGPGEVHASVEAGQEGWLVCLCVSVQELVQERYTLQTRLEARQRLEAAYEAEVDGLKRDLQQQADRFSDIVEYEHRQQLAALNTQVLPPASERLPQ